MSQKSITISRPKASTPESWVKEKVEPTQGPSKRLTLDVPVDLHRRIKIGCASQDRLMADVLREVLEAAFPKVPK